MFKHILVPLDGSRQCEDALLHATRIARQNDSIVILLHVVEHPRILPGPYDSGFAILLEPAEQNELRARHYLSTIETKLQDERIPVRTLVVRGPIAETIIKTAERESVDLVVMASEHRSGLSRLFLGSLTFQVEKGLRRGALLVVRVTGMKKGSKPEKRT
jgi:nucleotide-binding universal stress UspA family protein